jgi:hypothetical protein
MAILVLVFGRQSAKSPANSKCRLLRRLAKKISPARNNNNFKNENIIISPSVSFPARRIGEILK